MMNAAVETRKVVRYAEGRPDLEDDLITVEEPMEIRIGYSNELSDYQEEPLTVTMRTPGNDYELAVGLLYTEGIINDFNDIRSIRYCVTDKPESQYNIVKVALDNSVRYDATLTKRNFLSNSSCGICGKASLEAIGEFNRPIFTNNPLQIEARKLYDLAEKLREEQVVFKYTGSIHAAGLFDLKGQLLMVYEDIGRHNAVDKLIGAALAQNLIPSNEVCMMVSGRAGFELVQKAIVAGIPLMGAVGAPSNLAISLAQQYRMTLVGFIKQTGCNIYAGFPEKLKTTTKSKK